MYSLIIVDDDELIRKGLEKVIGWEKLGFKVISTFSSAIEALAFLKDNLVDVILTDIKMPQMTGLELIEKAKKLNPDTKAVIISGYNEFDLVKSALTLKVEDYLLKPLAQKDVEAVFTKVKDNLDSSKNTTKTVSDIQDCYYILKKLTNSYRLWDEYITNEDCKLILIKHDLKDEGLASLSSIISPYQNEAKGNFILLLTPESEAKEIIDRIIDIFTLYKETYKIMIGSKVLFVDDITPSFWSAFDLIPQTANNSISYYENHFNNASFAILRSERNNLIKIIETKGEGELKAAINNILCNIKDFTNDERRYIFCGLIIKIANYFTIDYKNDNFICPNRNIELSSKEELENAFLEDINKLITSIKDLSNSNVNLIITKCKRLINNKFSDQTLSLLDIADELKISYGYLSSIFTKIEGKSFKTFLVELRMEEARKLLLSRKYKIYEIADKVGYSNTKYFTEAFHKYYGNSPSDYLQKLNN